MNLNICAFCAVTHCRIIGKHQASGLPFGRDNKIPYWGASGMKEGERVEKAVSRKVPRGQLGLQVWQVLKHRSLHSRCTLKPGQRFHFVLHLDILHLSFHIQSPLFFHPATSQKADLYALHTEAIHLLPLSSGEIPPMWGTSRTGAGTMRC